MAYSDFEKSEISRITKLVFCELSQEDIVKIHSILKRLGLVRYLVWESDNQELIESFSILPLAQAKKDIRFSQDYWLLLFARWRFILHGKYCFHYFDDLQKNSVSEIQRYIDAHVQLLSLNAFVGRIPLWHPYFQMPSPFLLESGAEFWGFGGYPA